MIDVVRAGGRAMSIVRIAKLYKSETNKVRPSVHKPSGELKRPAAPAPSSDPEIPSTPAITEDSPVTRLTFRMACCDRTYRFVPSPVILRMDDGRLLRYGPANVVS